MKKLLEKIIQKRNPNFSFDCSLPLTVILALAIEKGFSILRSYKLLLRLYWPNKLFLGKRVQFFNIQNIQLGKWTKLGDYCYLSALGKGKLSLGDNVGIGAHSRIIISTSFQNIGEHITIGNNVGIGEFAYLGGAGGLTIGNDCIVGQYFSCHPENHNYKNTNLKIRAQGVNRKGIFIGENCWIGSKVTILDGVTIGNNCIIAAGAVVNKNMPNNCIIGGVPAKVIKQIDAKNISEEKKYKLSISI